MCSTATIRSPRARLAHFVEVQRVRHKQPPAWRLPVIDDAPRPTAGAPADVLGLARGAHEAAMPELRDGVIHNSSELAAVVFLQYDQLVPRGNSSTLGSTTVAQVLSCHVEACTLVASCLGFSLLCGGACGALLLRSVVRLRPQRLGLSAVPRR